mgnify:CR=1 FL=1
MDLLSIEKFIKIEGQQSKIINVHFKGRPTITGVFIALHDYEELKAKNFWRLVSIKNYDNWMLTQDIELTRLFNGSSFTKLSLATKTKKLSDAK